MGYPVQQVQLGGSQSLFDDRQQIQNLTDRETEKDDLTLK